MINAITSALSGLHRASQNIDASARTIAQHGTSASLSSSPADADNFIEPFIEIKISEASFKANLSVLKTINEMQDELIKTIDIKA
jgi:hypothetical protein